MCRMPITRATAPELATPVVHVGQFALWGEYAFHPLAEVFEPCGCLQCKLDAVRRRSILLI